MAETHARGVSVTFTPVYKGKYLFVRRQKDDPVLGGYWCFPGGKVHVGETLATAIARECKEETGLDLTGRAFFVDSYLLGERVGTHFAVEVTNNKVTLQELDKYVWVASPDELAQFSPLIPGIQNHLHYVHEHLGRLDQALAGAHADTHESLHSLCWRPIEQFDLVSSRFLNA
jgi:8-oxo-dGTP pyrophosphatase MutT (NUDIX family)